MSDWKQIKKGADVELAGVKFAFEREDGAIRRITITDANGKSVRVAALPYGNGVEVYLPVPPPKVEKFVVEAEVAGMPLKAAFDERHEAEQKKNELSYAGVTATVTPATVDDDIPF